MPCFPLLASLWHNGNLRTRDCVLGQFRHTQSKRDKLDARFPIVWLGLFGDGEMADIHAELIFAFVYTVGTDGDQVIELLKNYLKQFRYSSHEFRISQNVRKLNLDISFNPLSAYQEMSALMDAGNRARKEATQNDILAVMAVNEIADQRKNDQPLNRVAQLIRSLKTPEEVSLLREVYRPGFFLIGIASNDDEQHRYLTKVKGLSDNEAQEIVQRDQDERLDYGQRTRDTFYLADVFVELAERRYEEQLGRFLDLVFGHPFRTPTREEHAMFMAYASAARSAQLGRQVGAAISTQEGEVIAAGFNEVPKSGGGAYWECDPLDARDHVYQEGIDSNFLHRSRIVDSVTSSVKNDLMTEGNVREVLTKLDPNAIMAEIGEELAAVQEFLTTEEATKARVHSSELKDITEYGRAVHAEMDSLLTCARLCIGVERAALVTTNVT